MIYNNINGSLKNNGQKKRQTQNNYIYYDSTYKEAQTLIYAIRDKWIVTLWEVHSDWKGT